MIASWSTARVWKPAVLIILALAVSIVGSTLVNSAYAQNGPQALVSLFSTTYGSSNVTDPGLAPGNDVTFEVTVGGAPIFNGYEFTLYYDPSYLMVSSLDVSSGTVFSNPFVAKDDTSIPGTLALAVVNLGSAFSGGSGVLVHLHFNVVGVGVSPLTLAAGTANPSPSAQGWTRLVLGTTPIDVSTSDGYFKNVAGKLGPVASFSFSPEFPLTGQTVIFNSAGSFDADSNVLPNGGISVYRWEFGDGFGEVTLFPLVAHHYVSGNFSARLTVADADDGFLGIETSLVNVNPVVVQPPGFTISVSPNPVSIPENSVFVQLVTVVSLGTFSGNVVLSATVTPAIANGLSASPSPITVSVPSGGSATSSLTLTTLQSTPPGRYVVTLSGTSGGKTEITLDFVVVAPQQPFFVGRFTWSHHISVSSNPTETWTGQVFNPNSTPLTVWLHIDGTIAGSTIFTAESARISLPGGASQLLTASFTFTPYFAGLAFGFTASIRWSFTPNVVQTSSSTVKGSFTVGK